MSILNKNKKDNLLENVLRMVCFELHKQCNTIRMLWMRSFKFIWNYWLEFLKEKPTKWHHFRSPSLLYRQYLFSWRQASSLYIGSEFIIRVENLSPAMGRGIDSRNQVWNWVAKLHRLAGRYGNPMPTWFLAPIAGLKFPTQISAICLIKIHKDDKKRI